mmetsp:Transcript_17196/g.60410  ORF Transcript_17196/g.60410 Transcript_17196/m.60410 type:complete len:338 (-) Transcript_17196:685-1698(-)
MISHSSMTGPDQVTKSLSRLSSAATAALILPCASRTPAMKAPAASSHFSPSSSRSTPSSCVCNLAVLAHAAMASSTGLRASSSGLPAILSRRCTSASCSRHSSKASSSLPMRLAKSSRKAARRRATASSRSSTLSIQFLSFLPLPRSASVAALQFSAASAASSASLRMSETCSSRSSVASACLSSSSSSLSAFCMRASVSSRTFCSRSSTAEPADSTTGDNSLTASMKSSAASGVACSCISASDCSAFPTRLIASTTLAVASSSGAPAASLRSTIESNKSCNLASSSSASRMCSRRRSIMARPAARTASLAWCTSSMKSSETVIVLMGPSASLMSLS